MKIGITIPTMVADLDRDTLLAWMRRSDAGPFSTLAAGERIAYPNQEMLVTLAAAASVTERIEIALTVAVLPIHATILFAKQLATIDVISGGRLVLGVGTGGREEDYRAAGASFERRFARMEEQVALMRRVWAGEVIDGLSKPVGPGPVQAGGPEILAGVLTPKSVRRAARWADGICGFEFGPDAAAVKTAFELARGSWQEQGRERPPRLVTSAWYALGPKARATMDDYVTRYLDFLGADVARAIAPACRLVSEQALRDSFRELEDAGVEEFILVPTSADLDQLDRLAELV